MAYCLTCGKLREIRGGMCDQCRKDEAARKGQRSRCESPKIEVRVRDGKMFAVVPKGFVCAVRDRFLQGDA